MDLLLTPEEMALADRLTIEAGTPGAELMERAGAAVAATVTRRHPPGAQVIVLCGPGNNGGDGAVAARLLRERGYRVRLGLTCPLQDVGGDAAAALARWPGIVESADAALERGGHCIVDALYGAGLSRPVAGADARLILAINAAAADVVSVDLPSGIDGRSGAILGEGVRADCTVTFFRKKPGHCLYPGKSHCGEMICADIGIAAEVLETIRPRTRENTPSLWRDLWRPPDADSHKYRRGHCIAVSGGYGSTGAIRLAARSALRCGAGLVTIATPPSALAVHAAHATAVMVRPIADAEALRVLLDQSRARSVVIGPGLGHHSQARDLVFACLDAEVQVVLDADALTLFESDRDTLFDRLRQRPEDATVLTPHDGEFKRLFTDVGGAGSPSKIDRTMAAAAAAHAIVVYKGADTVIGGPGGDAVVEHRGSPWLATAGSGDVLAGIVAGLGAQSVRGIRGAAMAVAMHGAAGRHAGPGLIAEDLVEAIRPVVADLASGHALRAGRAAGREN